MIVHTSPTQYRSVEQTSPHPPQSPLLSYLPFQGRR